MPGSKAAIAAGHPVSARAGADILRAGGTAVDAAISAILTAFAAEPVMSSPGGGGFAAVMHEDRPHYLDFFTSAPGQKRSINEIEFTEIFADFGTTQQGFHIGAGASAVPGMFPGLFALHERFGKIPFSELAQPALAVAREGVELTAFQSTLFSIVSPILLFTDQGRALFGQADGERWNIKPAGQKLHYPELADCLDAVAQEGVRMATHGEVASAMAGEADRFGGHLTRYDIQNYEVIWRDPLKVDLGRHTAFSNPAPAQGGAFMLALLKAMQIASASSNPVAWARAMDRVDRQWREGGGQIGPLLDMLGLKHPNVTKPTTVQRGTTHVSAVDAKGQTIAITVSNGEGNGRFVPGCGFMLNNMLGEEDVNPGGFHEWVPGERLSSMMAPTLIMSPQGDVLSLGSGGSNRIRTAMAQVIGRVLSETDDYTFDNALQQAVSAPRLHVERGHLDFEDVSDEHFPERYSEQYGEHLTDCLQSVTVWPGRSMYFGGLNAVQRAADGTVQAAGDPRRDGSAVIV